MNDRWIADRARSIEASGVRKVFELARSLKDPVNLSIGQPHFDVPEPIKAAAIDAIRRGANGYTVTQGIPELRGRIKADLDRQFGHSDREVLITSGTSGGLLLVLQACINPGDEVIIFDPYFVMYPNLVSMVGGVSVFIDTYPDFVLDVDRVKAVLSSKTKLVLFNSPSNPTGVVPESAAVRDLAHLCADRGVLLVSDEIYRAFTYDTPFHSPAADNPDVLVVDGFSKTYGMPGWRLGFAHGPKALIEEMAKLQQFTFVCAPSMVQAAGVAAWDFDVSGFAADYKRKRDFMVEGLRAAGYEVVKPGGAFYLFPKAPWATATEFVSEAIRNNLLVIPGGTFSRQDTHFRISYAASDQVLHRGLEILTRIRAR